MTTRFDQLAPRLEDVHRWFAACLAPTRLEILVDLCRHGESPVGCIARRMELDRSVISHALAALREGDLVRARAEGRRRLYRCGPDVRFDQTERGFTVSLRRPDGYEVTLTRRTEGLQRDGVAGPPGWAGGAAAR